MVELAQLAESASTSDVEPSIAANELHANLQAEILPLLRRNLTRCQYRLGPIRLSLFVPGLDYPALGHLVEAHESDEVDYELFFVEEALCDPKIAEAIRQFGDTSFRAKRFASGFYLTNHFGHPAVKVTTGAAAKTHVVLGREVHRTFWTFYAKYFLTHYSALRGQLHLKAGAVMDENGDVTLLVGKGSGGKSVLLRKLSQLGFKVLSNTHVILDGAAVRSVQTGVRVRADETFASIIRDHNLLPGPVPGEYFCPPDLAFGGAPSQASGTLRRIVVTHYGSGPRGMRSLDSDVLFTALKNLSYPLHTYGMKDDYLEFLGDDLTRFHEVYSAEMRMLKDLVEGYPAVYCNFNSAAASDEFADLVTMLTLPAGTQSPGGLCQVQTG